MATQKFIVEGRVQGVGFRWFTSRVAEAFDIAGQVRNLSDGAVEILATGTPENLRSFREQIGIGPSGSRVDRLIAEDLDPQRYEGFRIKG